MFHVGGGGRNRKSLQFVGFKDIQDCDAFSNAFIIENDENGKPIPVEKQVLTNESGRVLMDAKELKSALETGIGRLEIDGDYDTTYTTYAKDLDKEELRAMMNPGKGFYYLNTELHQALVEYGFSEEEVTLAEKANDIKTLIDEMGHFDYISSNFEEVPENNDFDFDIYKVGNKFYKKL